MKYFKSFIKRGVFKTYPHPDNSSHLKQEIHLWRKVLDRALQDIVFEIKPHDQRAYEWFFEEEHFEDFDQVVKLAGFEDSLKIRKTVRNLLNNKETFNKKLTELYKKGSLQEDDAENE